MNVKGLYVMIGVLLLGLVLGQTFGAHGHGGDSICSTDSSDYEPEMILQEVLSTCFPQAPNIPSGIDICTGSYINCNAFREVFQVIPSCEYCSRSGEGEKLCFYSQLNATRCSVNNFAKSFHCMKSNGGPCRQCDVQYFSGVTQTSTASFVENDDVPTTTMEAEYDNAIGIADAYRKPKIKCPHCEPCNCEHKEQADDTGLSVGTAVGLFFLGLILGIIVTIVICVCVPSLHSKTSVLRGKVREKIRRHSLQDKSTSQQHLDQTTNISAPIEATTHVIPSAPPGTGSFQAGYHTLDIADNARDSHMYTGLQPNSNIYQVPMGEGETYEEPDNQPIRGKNTVTSPVYQELPDNVIRNNTNNKTVTEDTNNEQNGAEYSGDSRRQSDHHYFVLEEQNQQPDNMTQSADTPYHDYFVLEKQQT